MRRVLLGVLGLALLAGCGVRPAASGPDIPPVPRTSTRPAPPQKVPRCAPKGVRISVVGGDAAMGLRTLSIELANCGRAPVTVHGYPALRLYDEDDQPVEVAVRQGSGDIAVVPEFDDPPRDVVLQPGEKARSGLLWRNLVTDSTVKATTATRLEAAPTQGEPWQDVPLVIPNDVTGTTTVTIDLGNTGKLGVQAWQKT
ncbi:DUF4232 domain-containing protein [Actinophytocola sp.]|uniref:DUF4232 domain-containing protein n=1 Tax=Actinophytocola sp. TaxID=1872138 RepID=UPI00389A0F2E